jgi:hypothetical protein
MANQLFGTARKKFLDGDIDLLVDDIRVVLVDANDYTITGFEEFLSAITDAALIGENGVVLTSNAAIAANTPSLASKDTTSGVFDAADVVLDAVTGDQAEVLLLFKWTGDEATSPLIAVYDTGTGLPITPNGGAITIAWSNGPDKIFALT